MAAVHAIDLCASAQADAERAAAAAIADVVRIEARYSRYRADSVTSAINREAGGLPVAIDPETAALVAYADRCYRLSDGRFEILSTSNIRPKARDISAAKAIQRPGSPGSVTA